MKTSSLIRMAAAAMVVLAIGIASARGQGEDPRAPRLWRATTGQTLKAAFVEIKAGAVVLKAEDGQLRGVPLNLLMPKDQAVAKDFAERMGAGGMFAVKPALPGRLPTFAEGPGKGFYAFYTNANFIVRVTDKAAASVLCIENGKPVGKPIQVNPGHLFVGPDNPTPRARAIASFDAVPGPLLQPKIISFTGLLKDDVRFGFNIAIEDTAVHTWSWAEDPPGIAQPTQCIPAFQFAASHSFEAHVMVVDQKAAVKDLSLVLEPMKGKEVVLPYGDIPKGFKGAMKSAEIKGPVFGSRRLSLAPGRSKNAEMEFYSAGHGALFSGYNIRLVKKNAASKDDAERITLKIE